MADLEGRTGVSDPITISVHGRNVTEATTREVAEQFLKLVDAVSEAQGGPRIGLRVTRVDFRCDQCDHRQPIDASREGWSHIGGDDLCPRCSRDTFPMP